MYNIIWLFIELMNKNKIENKNESFEFWLYLGIKLNSFM